MFHDDFLGFTSKIAEHSRYLPPAEERASRSQVRGQESIEEGFALVGQQRAQPAKGLGVGLVARRGDQPFQTRHARPHNFFPVEFFTRQLQQEGWLVMFERTLD
jgi:hypothetical protein